jgi:hypothetical protein
MGVKRGLSLKRRKVQTEGRQDRVLKKTFQPKKTEETSGCRKLQIEEVHDLYCSPYVIRVTKSSRMRWLGHAARLGKKCVQSFGGGT